MEAKTIKVTFLEINLLWREKYLKLSLLLQFFDKYQHENYNYINKSKVHRITI